MALEFQGNVEQPAPRRQQHERPAIANSHAFPCSTAFAAAVPPSWTMMLVDEGLHGNLVYDLLEDDQVKDAAEPFRRQPA
ncbi:MAG: hypothetical protein U0169_14620 [Polyangiaceae bacterium]